MEVRNIVLRKKPMGPPRSLSPEGMLGRDQKHLNIKMKSLLSKIMLNHVQGPQINEGLQP